MGGLLLVPHHIVTEYGIELWVIFDNPILETEKFFISTQLLPYSLFRLRILLRLVGLNDSPEIVDNCYYIFNKMLFFGVSEMFCAIMKTRQQLNGLAVGIIVGDCDKQRLLVQQVYTLFYFIFDINS